MYIYIYFGIFAFILNNSVLNIHFSSNILHALLCRREFLVSPTFLICDFSTSFRWRHSFVRFGATLLTLDLHESGIQTCDTQAFIGLTKLKKLMLWGNKLTYVPGDWFVNMYSLQTLDLSFNVIQWIDYTTFPMLSNLQNFYFDYNQLNSIDYNLFAYLGNLKKVKFSKNPWKWA